MPPIDSQKPIRPPVLFGVAVVFIIYGILSSAHVLSGLFHHRISFNPGVLALFVGPGLLRFSRPWRTCALILLWLTLATAPVFGFLLLVTSRPVHFDFFGVPAGAVPKLIGLAFIVIVFLVALWAYRVLMNPHVRRFFGLAGA